MGIRNRKRTLQALLRVQAASVKLDPKLITNFELLLSRARSSEEQDQVMTVFKDRLYGWQTNKDALAVVRRGFLDDEDEEEEDPPALKAALARSQVSFSKKS